MDFPEHKPLISFHHSIRSRYGETDKMGYVYYGRYLEYFEEARTEFVRELGVPYARMENEGFILPVIHAELDYKKPVYYDELMDIEVLIFNLPVVKLETYYRVTTSRTDRIHVEGRVTLCFMDQETRKPCRAPPSFIESLQSAERED